MHGYWLADQIRLRDRTRPGGAARSLRGTLQPADLRNRLGHRHGHEVLRFRLVGGLADRQRESADVGDLPLGVPEYVPRTQKRHHDCLGTVPGQPVALGQRALPVVAVQLRAGDAAGQERRALARTRGVARVQGRPQLRDHLDFQLDVHDLEQVEGHRRGQQRLTREF